MDLTKRRLKPRFAWKTRNPTLPAPTSKTNGKRTVSFGLSHDGAFLACGNGTRDGIVYVYDLNAKKSGDDGLSDDAAQPSSPLLAAKLLPHERHSGTMLDVIRSCAIAKDCRHVLGTTERLTAVPTEPGLFSDTKSSRNNRKNTNRKAKEEKKKKPSLTSSTTRKTKTQFDEIKKRCCSCCSSPAESFAQTQTQRETEREREFLFYKTRCTHTRKQRHLI